MTLVIAATYTNLVLRAPSNISVAEAVEALQTAASSGVNIWLHVGFYTSAPPFFKLADEAGLLSTNNVWINSE